MDDPSERRIDAANDGERPDPERTAMPGRGDGERTGDAAEPKLGSPAATPIVEPTQTARLPSDGDEDALEPAPHAHDNGEAPALRERRRRRLSMLHAPSPAIAATTAPERRSRSGWLAAALVVALIGWMASGLIGGEEVAEAPPPRTGEPEPVAVEVTLSTAQPIERTLTIEGEAEPGLSTPVRAEAGGIVEAVEARKGALVEAGDVIARIRPDERNAALAQARDAVTAAQAEFDRVDSLVARGFATRSRLEEARTSLSAAQSQLANAQAGLNDLTITAPASGALDTLEVDPGEVVQPGAEVATIVDTSRLVIEIRVPQRAIADVAPGQRAEVAFVTGQRAVGEVTFVAANAESATRTFPVEITVANPNRAVPSGVSAEVRLPIEEVEAHFVSPAILSLGETGALGVKVVEENETVGFYPAELVRAETGGIWVAGLPDEATIITVGQGFVATGERVRAVAEGETPELPPTEEPPTDPVPNSTVANATPRTAEETAPSGDTSDTDGTTPTDNTIVTTVPATTTQDTASATPDPSASNAEADTPPVQTASVPVETDAVAPDREAAAAEVGGEASPRAEPAAPAAQGEAAEPASTPPAPLDAPAPLDRVSIVTLAQERLGALGYDVGPRTGEENPRTRVAVGRFQSDEGLPVSGDLTDRTLARLGVEAAGGAAPTGAVALDAPLSIASLQTTLNALGFSAGAADGILGSGTRSAIRAFQEANDLPVTGQPSPELFRALRAAKRGG